MHWKLSTLGEVEAARTLTFYGVCCIWSTPCVPVVGYHKQRVTPPHSSFLATGVNFCGSLTLRTDLKYSYPEQKAYLTMSICMTILVVQFEVIEVISFHAFPDTFVCVTSCWGRWVGTYKKCQCLYRRGSKREAASGYFPNGVGL